MKFVLLVLCIATTSVFAQSKKQLLAENQKLKAESERLKAEIEQLKRQQEVVVTSNPERVSYSIGVMVGSNIKMQSIDSLNSQAMAAGLSDVLDDKTLKINESESQAIVQQYMESAMAQKTELMKKEGADFLAQNKTQAGVQSTASGLQYKVIKEGTGKQPAETNTVTVHYTGKLIDGTVFDSSVERGSPATFALNRVIRGWTEGLQLMKEGGKSILYIPYELGYGEKGFGNDIPPFSTLVFEVELIKVQ
jgi:FKBP-type peptidyl-prolyl cis-trans isomerase